MRIAANGTTDEDWFADSIAGSTRDPIWLREIVHDGKYYFNITNDDDLRLFVIDYICALLKASLIPLKPFKGGWLLTAYAGTPEDIAQRITTDWLADTSAISIGAPWFGPYKWITR